MCTMGRIAKDDNIVGFSGRQQFRGIIETVAIHEEGALEFHLQPFLWFGSQSPEQSTLLLIHHLYSHSWNVICCNTIWIINIIKTDDVTHKAWATLYSAHLVMKLSPLKIIVDWSAVPSAQIVTIAVTFSRFAPPCLCWVLVLRLPITQSEPWFKGENLLSSIP